MAALEFVELLDGHHVDGTQAIDFRLERDDGFFRGHLAGSAGGRGDVRGGGFAVLRLGIGLLGSDRRRVRRGLAGLLHRFDIRQHLVQRALGGLRAQLRKVIEVTLRGGACHIEFAGASAYLFEHPACVANHHVLTVHRLAHRGRRVVRGSHLYPQRLERAHVIVQRSSLVRHRLQQRLPPYLRVLELAGARGDAVLHIAGHLLEPQHFGFERRRPLDHRGMRGPRVRCLRAQLVHGLASCGEHTLRLRQTGLGSLLLLQEPFGRGFGLRISDIEKRPLLLGLPPLQRDDLRLSG